MSQSRSICAACCVDRLHLHAPTLSCSHALTLSDPLAFKFSSSHALPLTHACCHATKLPNIVVGMGWFQPTKILVGKNIGFGVVLSH